jgi:hypothetical protein
MGDFNLILRNTHTAKQAENFLFKKQIEKKFTLSSSRIHITVSELFYTFISMKIDILNRLLLTNPIVGTILVEILL